MFDHRVAGDNVTADQVALLLRPEGRLPRQDRLQADDRRGGRGRGAEGGRHPGARPGLDDRAAGRAADLEPAGAQVPQLGWRGIVINIGNKNGVGNLPYANVGTPLASSAKLRQAFEEAIDRNTLNKVVFGGLDAGQLHPDPTREHRLVRRDEGAVHALRPRGREEARRRVRLPEPDRAPADAEHDATSSGRRSSSRPRRPRSGSTS